MSSKTKYYVWPIGELPKEFQRPEIDQLKEAGYKIDDARDAVEIFEQKLADFAGSKYAVAVDNCTDGIFLSLKYLRVNGKVTLPKRCYLSIPMAVHHAGCVVKFEDQNWQGVYQLKPYPIYDGAVRFTEGMYIPGALQCISFQIKKRLPIGKGGMIFTDDREAYEWLKLARFEGRNLEVDQWSDEYAFDGWNMYMTPEDAARGILIFDKLPKNNEDTANQDNYPDLSQKKLFKERGTFGYI